MYGYIIKKTSLSDIEEKVDIIASIIKKKREEIYHELLGIEIATYIDLLSSNQIKRDFDNSPFNLCVAELEKKLMAATACQLPTKYNLSVFAQILSTKQDSTYIKVLCENTDIINSVDAQDLEDIKPYHAFKDSETKILNTWKEIHKEYENKNPATIRLIWDIVPDITKVVYPSKSQRCKDAAYADVSMQILSAITGGVQLNLRLLYPRMEEVAKILQTDAGKELFEERVRWYNHILIDLLENEDIVMGREKKI